MFLLFEEAGKLLAGRVLSEAAASAQVELDSGKRLKVKAPSILLRFEQPEPQRLLGAAQALGQSIELDLAWEFSPPDEFGFATLAREYFSAPSREATLEQQVAMLMRLLEAPHYFRRAGKGRFRKAGAEVLAQALAAIEKKKQLAVQIDQWSAALAQGVCPAPIREQLYRILFKPDKNAPEYKAVVQAARSTQTAPLQLLVRAGAIDSAYDFHYKRFVLENFPAGTGFPKWQAQGIAEELALASACAFSIDDSATTEIDDALSVQGLGSGEVLLGIHIAAPGLAITRDSALDQIARSRLSTVYMPGSKLTMLPDELVQSYTLQAGRECPAVSLYLSLDEATLEIKDSQTRLERVPIQANLRHDQIDAIVTQEWLEDPGFSHRNDPQSASQQREQLSFLYRLAKHLKARRELVRGKPETFNRPDYSFKLLPTDPTQAAASPTGAEQVQISTRSRGAPLDLIVSEAMILANSTWGGWLAELGVPAIYRSQASLLPGVKVRMGTKALPHAGLGVASYAWSTSPLRRYTDLVNQWQIIACARHGATAALAAAFRPKDAELFAIISSFDAAYTAYNGFQGVMERFWTLRYVQQNGLAEIDATIIRESLARADTLPLVLPLPGAANLPRGARVRVRLGEIDLITLDVSATLLAHLDTDAVDQGAAAEEADEDEGHSDISGPLAISVDLDDAEVPAPTEVTESVVP